MNNGGNSFGNVESDLVSSCKCYLEKERGPFRRLGLLGTSDGITPF